MHQLVPRDYLNSSRSDPAPFEFCPVYGPGDAIAARRGQFELLRSKLHLGTGARVQRVLQKAMSGAPVTISVLGGSGKFPFVLLVWSDRSALALYYTVLDCISISLGQGPRSLNPDLDWM